MSCFVTTGITVKQLSLVKCMRGSRTFCRGGGGGVQVSLTKKSSDVVFFCFFFCSSAYFTEVKWSISKKSIIIFKVPEGVQHFPGGSNCLFPIETHITCNFPGGGGVWTHCPPSGSALEMLASGSVVLVCKCS